MTATITAPADPQADPVRRKPWRRRAFDLKVATAYLLIAVMLYAGLWSDPSGRYLTDSGQDQNQWEWFFAVTAHSVFNMDNPLFSDLQNYPAGVNLMANTVMLAVSVPLAVITAWCGPAVTWAVVLTVSLAATGTAWYWLLSRRLGRSASAAVLGGGFCAFAPPVISHANAHPNFVALFVLPLIIAAVRDLWQGRGPLRCGVRLGLLVALQIFIGEEVLLLFATGMAIFAIAYLAQYPAEISRRCRSVAAGFAVAVGVTACLVAYPLYWQFFGPQSYHSLGHGNAGNDLLALTAYASRSLGGEDNLARMLSMNPTEQNAFFGWPMVVFLVAAAIALWRDAIVRSLSIVVLSGTLLSLGSYLVIDGQDTPIPGPWWLVSRLPLYESVVESRLTMVCVPAIAILLAIVVDRVRWYIQVGSWTRTPRLLWIGMAVAVLLPLAPTPFETRDRQQVPVFFTDGTWRDYLGEGGHLVPVPVPEPGDTTALQWQIAADMGFSVPEGYFIGPAGPDRHGIYGAPSRPTTRLLRQVRDSGEAVSLDEGQLKQARIDLDYWEADAVVLAPGREAPVLKDAVEQILGTGQWIDGVWVWRVRR